MSARSRVAAVVAVTGMVAGCGGRAASPVEQSTPAVTRAAETGEPGGRICPRRLPTGSEPGYGFGTDEPAPAAPELAALERAWVCGYVPRDPGHGIEATDRIPWVRTGDVRSVAAGDLTHLEDLLAGLLPAPASRACTDDLGPRWMLVVSTGGDLTGVVVDDYGCRSARMTGDPFRVVPGEDDDPSMVVPGVLEAPEGLLEALRRLGG